MFCAGAGDVSLPQQLVLEGRFGMRKRNRTVRCVLVVAAAAAFASISAPAQAALCTPSYSGYGPTVTVRPEYSDPSKSEVDYNSSDFRIVVDPCLP